MDTQELLRKVRELVAQMYPDDEPDLLSIRLRKNGNSIRIPVPPKGFADAHGGLKENQLLLLSHLPDANSKGVSAKELRRKCGYKLTASVHKVLRPLRIRGLVEKDEFNNYRKAK